MELIYDFKTSIESPLIRGIDEPRPWDLEKLISEQCTSDKVLLDVGCGTAFKLLPLCNRLKSLIGLEPNTELLNKAHFNILKQNIDNILLVQGCAETLPFPDNYFDIVTVMLAPHDSGEIYRVLKTGGVAFIERVGDHDKHDVKKLFGKDEYGWRGYNYVNDVKATPIKDKYFAECQKLFSKVGIQDGYWKTYYPPGNLIMLLEQTPMVRNFNREIDKDTLNDVVNKFTTPRGIEVTQNRILMFCTK